MTCGTGPAIAQGKAVLAWRPAGDADDRFLRDVYASSREEAAALKALAPGARRDQIECEFRSRQAAYPIDFPGVRFHVLELDGRPVGRCYLQDVPTVVFVVDLILLPQWRGRGLGTGLLRGLIGRASATGRRLRLHVEKANHRAFALYARLGFRIVAELPQHHLLEHCA